jgi:hypothetical protein
MFRNEEYPDAPRTQPPQGALSTQTTAAMPPAMASAVTSTRPHCSGRTTGRRGANVLRRRRRHIRDTVGVQEAFGIVLVVVVVIAALIAVWTFVSSGEAWDRIGKGGLSLRDGSDRPAGGTPPRGAGASVSTRERDDDIRQMLAARNQRRLRRGEEPLDLDAELTRLTAPATDPALREEIRQLVLARNSRRARQGKEPLDVEAEIERQVRDLE